jgi:primosomal protein N' (replication factor Y) (superfamily II helicase)
MSAYAEVIIDLVSNAVDRPFHYSIPPAMRKELKPGMRVTVPLGKRRTQGYVLRLLKETKIDSLRDIIAITDPEPLLTKEQLSLIHWLSFRYYCRTIDALHAMVPASFRKGRQPGVIQLIEATPAAETAELDRAPVQKEALRIIIEKGPLARSDLARLGINSQAIRSLEKKGLVKTTFARPGLVKPAIEASSSRPHLMRDEQAACFEEIRAALELPEAQRILLHGITASGKTEIYMQSLACCLEQGGSALIMVPEIALTPQMIEQFEGRFPAMVAVLHSRLSVAEKNRQWQMILNGEARIVLGARSAVFAPLANIGLIIIDEEHETTYKQEEAPRYHTRDVAWWRARYHKAVLLLGSATPSLESYHLAVKGEQKLLRMTARVTPAQLPPVTIVDMRKELKENHRHIFSRPLLENLNNVLERDEQALLFINRRGFSGFVLCRECGYVVRCPSCDVSLTLHLDRQVMCCHYCAHEEIVPTSCPGCGGIKIRYFSAGTQRVEDEVKKLFPAASLIRMDSDTTTSRQAHNHYYRQFRDRKANILIGTQMIAKGFDFPGVTLVGVVAADTTLNLPDFRAPERTFQLLTQVAGRTARGPGGGRVIVQTYHPTHYSILAAADHDYRTFFEKELEHRRQLAYPPFADLLRFLFSGSDEKAVYEAAGWFTGLLEPVAGSAEVLGPAPASLYRIKEQYRVQTIIKGEALTGLTPAVKRVIREYHSHKPPWPVRLAVDFNPLVVL